jgi:hypothetical protein
MQFGPTYGYVNLIGAFIAAKWAMDLGFSQMRQVIWFIAGLLAAPLVLLILYVRLIAQAPESAKKWW